MRTDDRRLLHPLGTKRTPRGAAFAKNQKNYPGDQWGNHKRQKTPSKRVSVTSRGQDADDNAQREPREDQHLVPPLTSISRRVGGGADQIARTPSKPGTEIQSYPLRASQSDHATFFSKLRPPRRGLSLSHAALQFEPLRRAVLLSCTSDEAARREALAKRAGAFARHADRHGYLGRSTRECSRATGRAGKKLCISVSA